MLQGHTLLVLALGTPCVLAFLPAPNLVMNITPSMFWGIRLMAHC